MQEGIPVGTGFLNQLRQIAQVALPSKPQWRATRFSKPGPPRALEAIIASEGFRLCSVQHKVLPTFRR
jgi:hypothetical protein